MTEFSVGDRVLVPGVVEQVDPDDSGPYAATHKARFSADAHGQRAWFGATALRPDTGGRDLTINDLSAAYKAWDDQHPGLGDVVERERFIPEYLNRIARGGAGSAGGDTAPPADVRAQLVKNLFDVALTCMDLDRDDAEGEPLTGPEEGVWAGAQRLRRGLRELDGEGVRAELWERLTRGLAAAGPRAGDAAVSVNEHITDAHVSDHADHDNTPAGDTAPDDETRPYGCPDDCEDCQYVVDSLRAELDRLRSDAAAQRDAGNEAVDALDGVLSGRGGWDELGEKVRRARAAQAAWRSAAGEATT